MFLLKTRIKYVFINIFICTAMSYTLRNAYPQICVYRKYVNRCVCICIHTNIHIHRGNLYAYKCTYLCKCKYVCIPTTYIFMYFHSHVGLIIIIVYVCMYTDGNQLIGLLFKFPNFLFP